MNINYRMMRILAYLLDNDKGRNQRILLHADAALRLGTAFLCILLCAFSENAAFTFTVVTAELVRLACMSRDAVGRVVKKVLTAALFSMIILIPTLFLHQYRTMLTVTLKVIESVLVLSILNEIVSWKDLTDAFRFYHVPAVFVLTLDMTIRFLVILGRYSSCLTEAVRLRSVGRRNWKDSHIGGILGTTFLKSQIMAQQTAEAMACRCFDGTYENGKKYHFSTADAVYLMIPAVLVVFFVYTQAAV